MISRGMRFCIRACMTCFSRSTAPSDIDDNDFASSAVFPAEHISLSSVSVPAEASDALAGPPSAALDIAVDAGYITPSDLIWPASPNLFVSSSCNISVRASSVNIEDQNSSEAGEAQAPFWSDSTSRRRPRSGHASGSESNRFSHSFNNILGLSYADLMSGRSDAAVGAEQIGPTSVGAIPRSNTFSPTNPMIEEGCEEDENSDSLAKSTEGSLRSLRSLPRTPGGAIPLNTAAVSAVETYVASKSGMTLLLNGGSTVNPPPSFDGSQWERAISRDDFSSEGFSTSELFGVSATMPEEVKLIKLIGKGSYGDVFKGTWRDFPVAIKVLNHHLSDPLDRLQTLVPVFGTQSLEDERRESLIKNRIERAENEAALGISLNHPNLVSSFAALTVHTNTKVSLGSSSWKTFIIMELCEGNSLRRVIDRKTIHPFSSLVEILGIALDICRACDYLHKNQVIHGDIKSENVMLVSKTLQGESTPSIQGCKYQAKVADFGTSFLNPDPGNSRESGQTSSNLLNSALATPTHAAPELLVGGQKHSFESNVYALGVLLWELITGKKPYSNFPCLADVLRHKGEAGSAVMDLLFDEDCPAALVSLCKECWNDDPSKRPMMKEIEIKMTAICHDLVPSVFPPPDHEAFGLKSRIGPLGRRSIDGTSRMVMANTCTLLSIAENNLLSFEVDVGLFRSFPRLSDTELNASPLALERSCTSQHGWPSSFHSFEFPAPSEEKGQSASDKGLVRSSTCPPLSTFVPQTIPLLGDLTVKERVERIKSSGIPHYDFQ